MLGAEEDLIPTGTSGWTSADVVQMLAVGRASVFGSASGVWKCCTCCWNCYCCYCCLITTASFLASTFSICREARTDIWSSSGTFIHMFTLDKNSAIHTTGWGVLVGGWQKTQFCQSDEDGIGLQTLLTVPAMAFFSNLGA